jgi:hypothetical protein
VTGTKDIPRGISEAKKRQKTVQSLGSTLVNGFKIENSFALYLSFCSKYNPIEHRFFPHVARACQGKLLDTLEKMVQLISRTTTGAGLKATVIVIRRTYDIGRQVAQNFKANMAILFDGLMPKRN